MVDGAGLERVVSESDQYEHNKMLLQIYVRARERLRNVLLLPSMTSAARKLMVGVYIYIYLRKTRNKSIEE